MRAGGLGGLLVLLAEQVVGELGAARGGEAAAAAVGAERVDRGVRTGPHGVGVDPEQVGDLVVAAPTLEHELEHGDLVCGQGRNRHIGCGSVMEVPKRSCNCPTGHYSERLMSAPPRASNYDELYGLEFLEVSPDEVRARVVIGDQHKQPFGIVHGGLYAAIAESTASVGTYVGVKDDGKISM